MNIFPAIDIKDGKAVRLFQGDYDQVTVYGENPVAVAKSFLDSGATHLHLVDLDGAKDGKLVNFQTVKAIASQVGLRMQVGGGIRDEQRITQYLELGVERVILGTIAVTNFEFLAAMTAKYGNHIAVGVDAKDGLVAINGWKEITDMDSMDFCRKLKDIGVQTVIYTDISKDGGLQGTNLPAYEKLASLEGLQVIASGGISFEHEIQTLRSFGMSGAILGKAIYSGALDLARAIQLGEC